jgi:hypothetical protein
MRITSWKTTATGVLMILGALTTIATAFLQTGHLPESMPLLIGTIIGGAGLISARDNDKTSEETGAKVWEADRRRQELNK